MAQHQPQHAGKYQNQKRLERESIEVEHGAVRVEEPREVTHGKNEEQRCKPPVTAHNGDDQGYQDRRNKSPPDERVADIEDRLRAGRGGAPLRPHLWRLIVVRGGSPQQKPLPRGRRIRMGAIELGMEIKRRNMVLPERAQIGRQPLNPLPGIILRPMPVESVR